jgi:predicted dehydrogenase/threonine dehydrogenase-like Zn-dependent dehydrogenase
MKQVLQNLRSGETTVADVPAPLCRPAHLRIATRLSLLSSGTERMLVEFARGSLLSKARQQPEKVREALQKLQTDGPISTYEAIRTKLDQPIALGYCNVGRVLEVGANADGFRPGDRVVSNGKHAEIVITPHTLAAKIPDAVDDESAAFAAVAAIALQGVRLAAPTLGECFVVTGLGVIGLLTVQLLRANGCRVLGMDSVTERLALARRFGAETVDLSTGDDPLSQAWEFSRGRGVDGALLALSAQSSEPISQAAQMCRKRARIVLTGVTGLELRRSDFYEKELSFQVSCSLGPGRYDPQYEEAGRDYPFGFVRWTEQRNLEAVLDMMESRALDVRSLVTHRFRMSEAGKAYDLLTSSTSSLGVLLCCPQHEQDASELRTVVPLRVSTAVSGSTATLGVIGAGNYGGRVLIDAFWRAGARLHTIVSSSGVSAAYYGRKFGFLNASSDAGALLRSPDIDAICIATRHDSHAGCVRAALEAGKHVFVEKPLCLTLEEHASIEHALKASSSQAPILMVGFNRRFAPLTREMARLLAAVSAPKSFVMTVNAGSVPANHWTLDPEIGGGRIVGEACHHIVLLRHLAGASIVGFQVTDLRAAAGAKDTTIMTLRFADGSIGVINYFTNGHKAYPKERLEVFTDGRVLVLDNFRRLFGYGWPQFWRSHTWRQDKGQGACVAAFIEAVKLRKSPPIPAAELLEVSRIAIGAAQCLRGQ